MCMRDAQPQAGADHAWKTIPKSSDKRPWYIMHPLSLFNLVWDICVAAILVLMFVMLPLNFYDEIADSLAVPSQHTPILSLVSGRTLKGPKSERVYRVCLYNQSSVLGDTG